MSIHNSPNSGFYDQTPEKETSHVPEAVVTEQLVCVAPQKPQGGGISACGRLGTHWLCARWNCQQSLGHSCQQWPTGDSHSHFNCFPTLKSCSAPVKIKELIVCLDSWLCLSAWFCAEEQLRSTLVSRACLSVAAAMPVLATSFCIVCWKRPGWPEGQEKGTAFPQPLPPKPGQDRDLLAHLTHGLKGEPAL